MSLHKGKLSITQLLAGKYEKYLESREKPAALAQPERAPAAVGSKPSLPVREEDVMKIGIVGAGMTGLYSAMLLKVNYQDSKHRVKIFEANDRVGGRVYTHRFSDEPYQYFEGGAERFSDAPWQRQVFNLISFLNSSDVLKYQPEFKLDIIPFSVQLRTGTTKSALIRYKLFEH